MNRPESRNLSGDVFDIRELDAAFHLRALGPRPILACALGDPEWGWTQKRILLAHLLGRRQQPAARRTLVEKIQKTFGVRHAFGTATGREAIKLALLAMEPRKGQRVVLPSFCCLSVLIPVLELGLTPVFADVGANWQIDPESVGRVMRSGDLALIVPHLFGRLADMPALLKIARAKGARVIDDAAQAIGTKSDWGWAGCGADAGIFSFGLFKPLSAMGGGALITNDESFARQVRAIQANTSVAKRGAATAAKTYVKTAWRRYSYALFLIQRRRQQGNSGDGKFQITPDDSVRGISGLDALLAGSQLDTLDRKRLSLTEKAQTFAGKLDQVPFFNPTPAGYCGTPRWVVELAAPYAEGGFYRSLFAYLLARGVEVQPTYRPLHHFLAEAGIDPEGEFANSEALARRLLCLPFSPSIDTRHIVRCLDAFTADVPGGVPSKNTY